MKCIDKLRGLKCNLLCICVVCCIIFSGCAKKNVTVISEYEATTYTDMVKPMSFFAQDLAVVSEDVDEVGFTPSPEVYATGLFDMNQEKVLFGHNMFEKTYPASTTKIITAYVALKYGNLDDIVTITSEDVDLPAYSSVCGIRIGDQITMYDLIVGLLLKSGNDNAMAIANHISGDTSTFADLMTSEAHLLGATSSHFMNPHGLHDPEHYTTVYDLYLMFQACIQDERFLDIIQLRSYDTVIPNESGEEREVSWYATNGYLSGKFESPDNVEIIGGKTGYTDEALNCLVLLEEDNKQNPYISIVMGAHGGGLLYNEMTAMVETIPVT